MNLPRFIRRPRNPKRCPARCPHCGESLPPCIPDVVFEAIRVIAAQPGSEGTALDVVAAGVVIRRTRAAEVLRLAGVAGVATDRGWTVVASGRHAKVWHVSQATVDAYELVQQRGMQQP